VGGPPLADFSGTYNQVFNSPLSIRGLAPESEIKNYTKRVVEGCHTKFKRDDPEFNLMSFASEALNHMETHGMDTVFYMTGVDSNGKGGVELFTYHSRFTRTQVAQFIADKVADGTYDYHAQTCLKESAAWLVNSLDESLKKTIRPKLASRPSGPEVWMMIVAEIMSDSLRRSTILTDKFKALSLAKFPGEDVQAYAQAADEILLQLERDQQLPPNHLMDIVDHMSACSVMEFQIHWMAKRIEVEKFMKETIGKDKQAVALMPNKIHFRDLLEEATAKYIGLLYKWGKNPNKKEDAMLAQVKAMQAKVDKLTQQLQAKNNGNKNNNNNNGGKEKRKCYNCGSEDHLKPNCPHPPKEDKEKKPEGETPSSSKGKWAKPKAGEPHEKTINGKKRFWCSKCNDNKGRWNQSHKTDGHKTKEELTADAPTVRMANLSCDQQLFSRWFP
jgi:hypothetical protein